MGAIGNLLTYWAGNSTLNNAISATKLFLDLVPEGTPFPYVRISTLGGTPILTTGTPQIETFNYQLGIFHTNRATLVSLAATIDSQLHRKYPTASTLLNVRRNSLETAEETNGVFTYCIILEYSWTTNA